MSRVLHEALEVILARRKLSPEEWRVMGNEKLRRRDCERAGIDPALGITAGLAKYVLRQAESQLPEATD
jgi:hypothetical protein